MASSKGTIIPGGAYCTRKARDVEFKDVGSGVYQRAEAPGGWIYLSHSGHSPVFVADPKQHPIAVLIAVIARQVAYDMGRDPQDRLLAQAVLDALG